MNMVNARDELLGHCKYHGVEIKCADIVLDQSNMYIFKDPCSKVIMLKVGGDVQDFLKQLDFEYDAGYGTQQLHGIVWHTDGTWSDRGEYDGSEWWERRAKPEIPKDLK